jgi:YegS/Rv2252/BmrU family lipid kinase
MKNKEKTFVVVNPKAGGGAALRNWQKISEDLRKKIGPFDFEESTAMGHAQYLAADAANEGYSLVVAYGGDGTINEVINGIMEAKGAARPALGILSMGTGGDFVRTLGLPPKMEDQIRIVGGTKSKRIDLGRATYVNSSGETERRYFANIASAGLSADVVKLTPKYRSLLGRKPAYLAATLDAHLHWTPKKVKVTTEHGTMATWPEKPTTVVVANGKYFGGGMPIAPKADLSDSYFDLVVVGKVPAYLVPLAIGLLYSKKLHRLKAVHNDRVRKVELVAEGRVDLDIDGEAIGHLPATFEIVPKALEVKISA